MTQPTPKSETALEQYNAIVTARDRFQFQGMAAALFLFGVVLMFGQLWGAVRLIQSSSWPTTGGTIVKSESVRSGGRRTSYHARIEYEYYVNGGRYRSSRVSFGSLFGTSPTYLQLLEKYPRGRSVKVYVNAKNPSVACLNQDFGPFGAGGLMAGLVFSVAGAFLLTYLRAAKNLNSSGPSSVGMMEVPDQTMTQPTFASGTEAPQQYDYMSHYSGK